MKKIRDVFAVTILLMLGSSILQAEEYIKDEKLEQELIDTINIACDISYMKNLIENKKVNPHILDEDGDSLFTRAAGRRSRSCSEAAYYLSSIGVKDTGIAAAEYLVFFVKYKVYEKPRVFENKHLKMTLRNVWIKGSSNGFIENKADEPVYFIYGITKVNGIEFRLDYKKKDGRYTHILEPGEKFEAFGIPYYNKDQDKYPKISYNKIKFTREYLLKYLYKNKEYEFKIPLETVEFDVEYENFSGRY